MAGWTKVGQDIQANGPRTVELMSATSAYWRLRAAYHRDMAAKADAGLFARLHLRLADLHLQLADLMEAQADSVEKAPTKPHTNAASSLDPDD